MLAVFGRTSLAIGLGCASLTAQFVLEAQDALITTTPQLVPIAAVRDGNGVLALDNLGVTMTWSSQQSAWTQTSAPSIAFGFTVTRGNSAWCWAPVPQTLSKFNGSAWVAQTWSAGGGGPPSAIQVAALAALPNGDVILFGGSPNGTTYLNETWRLDASNAWTLVTTTGPSARGGAGMATDAGGNLILFGGNDTVTQFNDTWSFNGTTWTQLSPTTSPPARTLAGMAYHPLSQSIVLVGGNAVAPTLLSDAWEFVGGNWLSLMSSYASSGYGAITLGAAFDGASNEIVMPVIGGFQTVVVGWSGFGSFGGGCVCDNQTASFGAAAAAGSSATLNSSFTVQFTNSTPGNVLAMVFDSIQAFPPTPGPAGCPLYPLNWSTNFFLVGTTAGPFAVGSNPAMIGQVLFVQGVQPPLFGFNGCTSNGLEIRFGR